MDGTSKISANFLPKPELCSNGLRQSDVVISAYDACLRQFVSVLFQSRGRFRSTLFRSTQSGRLRSASPKRAGRVDS